MDSVARSFNFELSDELRFDKYARQILESGKGVADASTPTITTIDATVAASASSEFLQKLGASLLSSIQLQHQQQQQQQQPPPEHLEMAFAPNNIIIDSSSFDTIDDMHKQMDYDKFMNEVWIGIVLTLILISLIFCICSCFLYHQFRTWKQSYRSSVQTQAQSFDVESAKLQPDLEDPVPDYTLVSGLPSYDAALELLRRTPQSCLVVHPSVFNVFNRNERGPDVSPAIHTGAAAKQQQQQPQPPAPEVTTPLLPQEGAASKPEASSSSAIAVDPTYGHEKAPSYEEALFGAKQEKR